MADTAEYIVRLKDKVSRPAKGISRSLSKMRDQFRLTNRSLSRADKGMGRFIDKSGRMREKNGQFVAGLSKSTFAIGRFSLKMSTLTRGLQMARSAYLVAGAAAAFLGFKIAQAGLGVEKSVNALNRLTHGGGQAAFNEISNLAVKFGLNVGDTVHQYEKLLKLQFTSQQGKNLIKMGADMQALGNSAEEVQGILLALGQIKSKGRLQQEEINQLSERGISGKLIKEEVAKLLGVDDDSIEDLQRRGKVGADVALQAIENAINRKLGQSKVGEAGEEFASKTIGGMIGRFKAGSQSVVMGLGDRLLQGFKAEQGGLMGFGEAFKGGGGIELIQGLGEGMRTLGEGMRRILPLVLQAATAFGGEFFGAMKDGLGPLDGGLSGTRRMAAIFREDLIPAARTVGSVLGFAFGAATTAMGVFITGTAGVINALAYVVRAVRETPSALTFLALEFWNLGTNIVDGMWEGIKSGWASMMSKFGSLVELLPASAKKILGIASPSKEFAYLGRMSGEGFQKGLDQSQPDTGGFLPATNTGRHARAAGERSGQAAAGGGVTMGDVMIKVEGSSDPEATGAAVMRAFEARLGSALSNYAGELA